MRDLSGYWKINLFDEPAMDKPREVTHSTFSTDFHVTFGMFTCFDIMWKEPAFDLVNNENVTDFVFPTAWFSQLPFLSGN
ncbi:hypothetical protein J437_LFUL005798 [Ladona fulva]|uniref:CN hydrolase domain-containing protein n=1 Tax=Ladona fulva TaxID=123851 RepID=A0A8K0K1Y2_LADFU|nr:hypothetical protein J437_LFUL005798 [Ladona fulva]